MNSGGHAAMPKVCTRKRLWLIMWWSTKWAHQISFHCLTEVWLIKQSRWPWNNVNSGVIWEYLVKSKRLCIIHLNLMKVCLKRVSLNRKRPNAQLITKLTICIWHRSCTRCPTTKEPTDLCIKNRSMGAKLVIFKFFSTRMVKTKIWRICWES